MEPQTKVECVHLNHDDPRQVRYQGEDNHIGFATMKNAIQALNGYSAAMDIFSQMGELMEILKSWTENHAPKIKKAFFTAGEGQFLFVVVTKNKSYDADFEDQLTELDINVACNDSFKMFPMGVMSLPNCDEHTYMSFCNPDVTTEYKLTNADSK